MKNKTPLDNLFPGKSGYRLPAEWEPHTATQLHWPSNRETWPEERLQRVEKVFLDIIEALHSYEPIVLLVDVDCDLAVVQQKIEQHITDLAAVQIHQIPLNDVWARDCGPIFIKRNEETGAGEEVAITDWEYNAWGGKYPPYEDDNRLPRWFSETFGIPLYAPGMVLEGGSIDTNGEGILLTTESVLLHENRNPHLGKEEIEETLKNYLGIQKIIWLKEGLAGDDTDGHIDDLARFLNRNTILTMISEDPEDINYAALQENLRILQGASDLSGNPFQIVTLPMPKTETSDMTVDGSKYVPASYANFYIANGVVLLPLYDKQADEESLALFSKYFPDRDIIGIDCTDLVWGQGSIHCVTQQILF